MSDIQLIYGRRSVVRSGSLQEKSHLSGVRAAAVTDADRIQLCCGGNPCWSSRVNKANGLHRRRRPERKGKAQPPTVQRVTSSTGGAQTVGTTDHQMTSRVPHSRWRRVLHARAHLEGDPRGGTVSWV